MTKPNNRELITALGITSSVLIITVVVGQAMNLFPLRWVLAGAAVSVVLVVSIVGVVFAIGHAAHQDELELILAELKALIPPTAFKWLHSDADILFLESKTKFKSVWIISPDLAHDTNYAAIQRAVKKNLKRGISYMFIVPKTDAINALLPALRSVFASHPHLLTIRQIDVESFRNITIRHIAIFNPDMANDIAPEVFLELPIAGGGYWIDLSRENGLELIGRLKKVINR